MAETYSTPPHGVSAGEPNPVHVPPVEHPHTHERTDIATRPLWIFFGFFIVVAVLIHIGLYVLFFAYQRGETELDKERIRSAVRDVNLGPPEPRLQGIPGYNTRTPREDQQLMRIEDARRLNMYGPAQNGTARIPIDRAMDLLLERGLPVQPRQPQLGTQPTTRPATRPATQRGGPDAN